MGRSASVRQGRIIHAGPDQPADGNAPNLTAKTRISNGASQYSGTATKPWVTVVIAVSIGPPRRIAARIPDGSATAIARLSAPTASTSVTMAADPICGITAA